MKKFSVKAIITALCLIIFFSVCPLNISAEEINNITLLGDSITKGYGLKEGEKNYGMWLGEYFDANVSNYAVSGKTTRELIEELDTDPEAIESIKSADLICVSIGGNDLLDFIFDDLMNAANNYNSSYSGAMGLSPETVENLIISISTAIGPASITAGENTGIIADRLTELNPDAKIVFQTIYNPFESDNPDFKDMLPPLYTFTSIYLASINRPLMENEKIICADIKSKFKGLCPYFTNMNKLDIHPNKTGHIIIAEEIIQKLKLPGNFSIFKNAFDDMTEGTSENIPQILKNEISLISNGEFRTGEIPTEPATAKVTVPKTTYSTKVREKPSENNIRTEREGISVSAICAIIAGTLVLTAVIIVIAVKKRSGKKRG